MRIPSSLPGQLASRIIERLGSAGHKAYLVGGCVRDLLLGNVPKDYDVATGATPDQTLSLFPGTRKVGAHFGVVLVREGETQVEVATFRSDHAYCDGRHPVSIEFETDPRRDVLRRDFTINALLMDPLTGHVMDYVNGQDDLKHHRIRTVGDPDARFREDHLRMLRAVRFAARLGFRIETATFDSIKRQHSLITAISSERIRDELLRILTESGARRGFELLDETGLLADILPEVAAMKGVKQPPEFHPEGDVWTHTLIMLEALVAPSPTLALGVLLHDVGKPPTFRVSDRIRFDGHAELGAEMAGRILTRLRFSNEHVRQVEALIANHLRFKDVRQMRQSTLRRMMRLDRFEEHLELHRLDCLASHGMLDNHDFVKEKLEELSHEELRPPRLITGHDLIREGYKPSPLFAEILEIVETAQLESVISTPEEALALIRSRFAPLAR